MATIQDLVYNQVNMVCVHTLIRGRQESLANVQFFLKVNVSRALIDDILLNKDQVFRYISDFMQLYKHTITALY